MKKIVQIATVTLVATLTGGAAIGHAIGLHGCPLCWGRQIMAFLGFGG